MNGSSYAERGFSFAVPVPPQRVVFGFTAPTSIYEKQRTIDRSAQDLNTKIHVYSRDPGLKAAWDAWYSNWQIFFSKYQDSTWNKLGASFYSDELNLQTDDQWKQYVALQTRYESEREPTTNRPLPAPIVPLSATPPTPPPGGGGSGWSVPTWVWVGLGVAALGVGAYVYLQYRELKAGAGALGGIFGGRRNADPDPRRDPTNISFYAHRLAHDYPALTTPRPTSSGYPEPARALGFDNRDMPYHNYDRAGGGGGGYGGFGPRNRGFEPPEHDYGGDDY